MDPSIAVTFLFWYSSDSHTLTLFAQLNQIDLPPPKRFCILWIISVSNAH
uniref:Uncharacterized protein n=1 Tax=Anguilla anguilla TaxID=7936 RepID=A0A0E9UT10_ANGAN